MAENDHTDSTRIVKRIDISDIKSNRMYFVSQIVDALGINTRTFAKMVTAGLPVCTLGKERKVYGQDVIDCMRNNFTQQE